MSEFVVYTDKQVAAGVIGALLLFIQMRYSAKTKSDTHALISWPLIWFAGKFGVNMYEHVRNMYGLPEQDIVVSERIGHMMSLVFVAIIAGSLAYVTL